MVFLYQLRRGHCWLSESKRRHQELTIICHYKRSALIFAFKEIYIFASQWFTIHSAQASSQVELGAILATFDNSYILDWFVHSFMLSKLVLNYHIYLIESFKQSYYFQTSPICVCLTKCFNYYLFIPSPQIQAPDLGNPLHYADNKYSAINLYNNMVIMFIKRVLGAAAGISCWTLKEILRYPSMIYIQQIF